MSIPFMNTIQTQMGTTTPANQQPLVLNEGQMIHGKIQQLFPGQLAEVQVGNHKMVAQLEVPMRAGDSYYFQVTSIQPEVQLKIISGPTSAQANSSQQLQSLMQAMQLPKSPEMTQLLSFILDNKVPISREGILQAVQLLQNTPAHAQQSALTAIHKMLDLKLPLTNHLFQAILGVETKEGLHTSMQSLKTTLQNDSSIPTQVRNNILQLLTQVERPLAASTSHALLGETLKTLLNNEQSPESRFSALQLLKSADIVPRQTSLPNLSSTLAGVISERAGFTQVPQGNLQLPQVERLVQFVSEINGLSASQKENLVTTARSGDLPQFARVLVQMLSENVASRPMTMPSETPGQQPAQTSGQAVTQTVQTLLSMVNNGEPSQAVDKPMTLLQNAEQSSRAVVQQLVHLAESTVSAEVDGKVMKDAMQTIFRSLGMNYESTLLGKEADSERFMQMLKPQLLAMLNEPGISAATREVAEQFVVRMNGGPLMSTESGVNHQLVMQLPLEFFGKKIDATLQWNGRMKDDQKIDADFARILFYLNLHSLQETVVDMQVQNRIVTITVFNEDPFLKTLGQPLQEKLKDGLSSLGYTLSGVFFKEFLENEPVQTSAKTKEVTEGGLDFRI